MLEVVAGQEVTMQNFPHRCLDGLAVQHEEVVFFSGEKEDSLSSNFLTSAILVKVLAGIILNLIQSFGTKYQVADMITALPLEFL